jgi:hypothetical protein
VRQLKKADSKDSKESNGKPKASVGSPAKGPIGHGKDAISINLSGPGKDEKPSGGKSPKKSPQDKQKVRLLTRTDQSQKGHIAIIAMLR